MATIARSVLDVCHAARAAAADLARADTATKNAALEAIAAALERRASEILEANAEDLASGREAGLDAALLDRLALDELRIGAIAQGTRAIAALPDPVGEVIEGFRRPNGLEIEKLRVPLGVVAVVYEARPNVTIDAAALCLKSGNAIVLRGSSAAARSNAVLAAIASEAVASTGLPSSAISLIDGGQRDELRELASASGLVDLIIPRGGEGLKAALQESATVPVIYAASGNCHVYVDAAADLAVAREVVLNAKVQRPGVCNAAETLLVHRDVAAQFVPVALDALAAAGVELRGDQRVCELAGDRLAVQPAVEADWDTEYLGMTIVAGVVDSLEQAIAHINRHGSGHSEAIVTTDVAAAREFQLAVDAACVYVNASTRFTDGGEFGMGAEIGNSTQKLHARGPIGLRELCTIKYLVTGDGHVRS